MRTAEVDLEVIIPLSPSKATLTQNPPGGEDALLRVLPKPSIREREELALSASEAESLGQILEGQA